MKKLYILLLAAGLLVSCEDFLEIPPALGLSSDKLTDLESMQALVMGAYDNVRISLPQAYAYSNVIARDIISDHVNHTQFFDHNITETMTSWYFTHSYYCLDLLNKVLVADFASMDGTDETKNAILGDAYFLRALIYIDLSAFYTLHSSGYTSPYLDEPVGPNDKVSCSKIADARTGIEADIEAARTLFANEVSGNANYYAATALAARIHFYHGNYDLAYQRADEVISDGGFSIPGNVKDAFSKNASSDENIFNLLYKSSESNLPTGPLSVNLPLLYIADINLNTYWMNPDCEAAQFFLSDPADRRFTSFIVDARTTDGRIYVSEKYPTDQMNMPVIRLSEMYLTRAEANITRNNSVSQQDVDDINILRTRANPATVLTAIPTVSAALDMLYEDRVKELLIEGTDRYHNIYRLQRAIVKTAQEGGGLKPFSEYADLLAWPLPQREVDLHDLTRTP